MAVLSRSVYVLAAIDALFVAFITFLSFSFVAKTYANLFLVVLLFLLSIMVLLGMKGFYKVRKYGWKDIYLLFEGIFIGAFLAGLLAIPVIGGLALYLILIDILLFFGGILFTRICFILYKTIFKPTKNFFKPLLFLLKTLLDYLQIYSVVFHIFFFDDIALKEKFYFL